MHKNKPITTVTAIKAACNCLSLVKPVILLIDKYSVLHTRLLIGGGRGSVLVEEGYSLPKVRYMVCYLHQFEFLDD